jgi:hypothetical protein
LAAWLLAGGRRDRAGLAVTAAAVAAPLVATAILFPGQGAFPYPLPDFLVDAVAGTIMLLVIPRREHVLRAAAGLYLLATVASFLIRSPMGGNIGRLGECLAIPLGACLLWSSRRLLFVALAVPMALLVWPPAWSAMTGVRTDPSTHQAYFRPLMTFLRQHAEPAGRVEVVPTRYHWEAAYVAPAIPLARGWERQLDTADNPIFYDTGKLDAASYHAWLVDNGVRYVALSDASLDFAGAAEARLVQSGVRGLVPAWQSAHWRVFAVTGSSGIVDGPARLVSLSGGRATLEATGPGAVVLRVRDSGHWTVTDGAACVSESPDQWTMLRVPGPELVKLELRLASPAPGHGSACP